MLTHMMKRPFLFKVFQHLIQIFPPEAFPVLEGKFKRSTLNMAEQDKKVIRIDQAMLWRLPKKVVRIFDDELIEGLAPGNENRQ
jgi:hypothetical protein